MNARPDPGLPFPPFPLRMVIKAIGRIETIRAEVNRLTDISSGEGTSPSAAFNSQADKSRNGTFATK